MEIVGEASHQDSARGLNGVYTFTGHDNYHQLLAKRSEFKQERVASTRDMVITNPITNTSKTLVVCEFLDVFPEKPPGMPPPREVEFAIELTHGQSS